ADGIRTIVEIAHGFRLYASTSAVSPGAQVVAAIRPEKLWFVDHEATKAGSTAAVDGTIEQGVYVGDLTRYQGRVAALDAPPPAERPKRGGAEAPPRGGRIPPPSDPP